ncbi:MAG: hypothetical protein LC776_14405, partial [Acidobacteria bacterium]|nr:hypothetical protein [Acidobacteriota bacterium]
MTNTLPRSRKLRAVFTFLIFTVAAFGSVPLVGQPRGPAQVSQVDLLIRGGKVLDGSGSPPFRADVGIRGDRIVFTGDAKKARLKATRTIEAAGLMVAPGFIDPHTHTVGDLSSPERNSNLPYL